MQNQRVCSAQRHNGPMFLVARFVVPAMRLLARSRPHPIVAGTYDPIGQPTGWDQKADNPQAVVFAAMPATGLRLRLGANSLGVTGRGLLLPLALCVSWLARLSNGRTGYRFVDVAPRTDRSRLREPPQLQLYVTRASPTPPTLDPSPCVQLVLLRA
jgi:hypothetical protein